MDDAALKIERPHLGRAVLRPIHHRHLCHGFDLTLQRRRCEKHFHFGWKSFIHHARLTAMKYYKTDSRKISFREYWHISRGTGFLIGWFNKALGIPMNFIKGIPEPQAFREKIIEAETVPSKILTKLNSSVLDLKQIGFDQFWYYTSKNSLTEGAAYGVQALHSSQKTIGKIVFASFRSRESLALVFVSELNDGTFSGTTNNRRQFNPPPGYIVSRQARASAAELWELHQNKLAKLSRDNNPPKTIGNLDQVVEFENKTSRMFFEDKVARGIWVEMTDSEVEAMRSKLFTP